jgi:hypothetical protein
MAILQGMLIMQVALGVKLVPGDRRVVAGPDPVV